MPRTALAALLTLISLGACQPIPAWVPFENDRRVFRGTYEGEVNARRGPPLLEGDGPVRLRIEAAPVYIDPSRYTVTGTITIGDAPPSPFEGEVRGGDTQLYVLTLPILGPVMGLYFDFQGESWHLGAIPWSERTNSPVSWYASLTVEAETKGGAQPYRYYDVELEIRAVFVFSRLVGNRRAMMITARSRSAVKRLEQERSAWSNKSRVCK